jgi:hypothetical protein
VRRLPLIDAGLLAVLLSLSLAALVLHVRQMALGGFQMVGVYLSSPETPDAHPTVSGIWPGAEQSGLELAVGDRLLRLGSTDLSGVGPLRFFALAQEQRARALQEGSADVKLHLEFQRGGAQGTTMLPFVPVRFPWRMLPERPLRAGSSSERRYSACIGRISSAAIRP